MSEKDALIDKLDAERKRVEAELKKVAAEAESQAADAQMRLQQQSRRRELEALRDDLADRLNALKEGGEAAFAELKLGAERALERLRSALSD